MRWVSISNTEEHLYIGGLYIGSVNRMVPINWREWGHYKIAPRYVKDNVENQKRYYVKHDSMPWRGWLMTDDDGQEAGWWESMDVAKAAMMTIASSYIDAPEGKP